MRLHLLPWTLLLGMRLVAVASSPCKPACPKDSCLCNGNCRPLQQGQTCCFRKDGSPEHICGPNKDCCREGCCREGWKCGDNGMCKPPLPTTSNPTTIVTLTKSDPVTPTSDQHVSGTSLGSLQLPSASTIENESMPGVTTTLGSSNMPPEVPSTEVSGTSAVVPDTTLSSTYVRSTDLHVTELPGEGLPGPSVSSMDIPGIGLSTTDLSSTNSAGTEVSGTAVPGTGIPSTGDRDVTSLTTDTTETGIPTVTTNSDDQVTTSPKQTMDPSMHIPSTVITNPDDQVTTSHPHEPSTVTSGTGSDVSTVQPDQSSEPGAVHTGTVITGTDGRVTAIPAEQTKEPDEGAVGTDSRIFTTLPSGKTETATATVITDLNGQLSTVLPPDETETAIHTATIITSPEGQLSTVVSSDETGTGTDTATVTDDLTSQPSIVLSGGETGDGTSSTITNSHGQPTTVAVPDGTSTGIDTATTSPNSQEPTVISTDTSITTKSDGQISSDVQPETSGSGMATQIVTTGPTNQASSLVSSHTLAIPETAPSGEREPTDGTSTEDLNTGGQQLTSSGDTLTQTTGSSDEVTTISEPADGQITPPSDDQTTVSSEPTGTEDGGLVIVPITTPVPNTERDDDGIKIPCDIWFFNLCIAPIEGWGIIVPPGIHPPGPIPPIKIDPTAPIKVDITGSIPWPEFTVDPVGNPTFSEKPNNCETRTATMCITSTIYGVSIDGTITSTTATDIVSRCGSIYGCDVEDDDVSKTITSATTATTEIDTATAVMMAWETWDVDEYTDAELHEMAEAAQSRIDEKFGEPTTTTSRTTTEAMPTLTRSPGTIPSSSGFSCASTVTYTQCGGPGGDKACVQNPGCASWVNTEQITMTTPAETPICSAGYETYTASAKTVVPTDAGPLRFFIPVADEMGSDWDFTIDSDDVKGLIESWKVGNDDDDPIEGGDGGKDIEIKWKVPEDSEGTYVELQFKDSDIKDNTFKFTAFGGVTPCMPNCKDDATTTTDVDGMVCTHFPCHSPDCEQGPAPEPKAACLLVEDGVIVPLFYTVTIVANGYSWIEDGGDKLKDEEEGCGAMTDWDVDDIEKEMKAGWTARHRFTFTLPITIAAGCVERAIASAGGPSGIECDSKQGNLW